MNQIQIFNYEGQPVSFRNENGMAFLNATEMSKRFGKLTADWLRLKSTQEFAEVVSSDMGIPISQLIDSQKGNSANITQGTWLHEIMALDFAQWLSPRFKLWCIERLRELMNHGFTATDAKLEELINDPDLVISLATQLKEERHRREQLQADKERQEAELIIAKPKADYYDNVLSATNAVPVSIVADDMGFSAIELNKILKQLKIQYKVGGKWCLHQNFRGNDYTENITHYYTKSNGETGSKVQMYWTQKGRQFIHDLIRENQIIPRSRR